jgi:hypothetical protein
MLVVEKLDQEFKMFMRWRGINIDGSVFELRFNEPQNFAKYRQAEVDATRIQAFTSLEPVPYISKRFLLKRYLDLSEEEMQENEEMWNEENGEAEQTTAPEAGLRAVGVTTAGLQQDMDNIAPVEPVPGEIPAGAAPETVGAAPEAPGGGLGL